ncbi:MAG: hypothetical protein M1831_004784 [Alyxoria varia]|nr:MAG: hypothetical protein M1831_004784 [Alyxoria varia]
MVFASSGNSASTTFHEMIKMTEEAYFLTMDEISKARDFCMRPGHGCGNAHSRIAYPKDDQSSLATSMGAAGSHLSRNGIMTRALFTIPLSAWMKEYDPAYPKLNESILAVVLLMMELLKHGGDPNFEFPYCAPSPYSASLSAWRNYLYFINNINHSLSSRLSVETKRQIIDLTKLFVDKGANLGARFLYHFNFGFYTMTYSRSAVRVLDEQFNKGVLGEGLLDETLQQLEGGDIDPRVESLRVLQETDFTGRSEYETRLNYKQKEFVSGVMKQSGWEEFENGSKTDYDAFAVHEAILKVLTEEMEKQSPMGNEASKHTER